MSCFFFLELHSSLCCSLVSYCVLGSSCMVNLISVHDGKLTGKLLKALLFMYTASVMFDYYCKDSELSYFGGIGFQSTLPLEGAGVFNVPEGDSPQNTEPPFIA